MTMILSSMKNIDEEGDKDRLSDLPDCVLLYIFSFLKNPKHIIQTCILSTRWKHLWKRGFPILTLHYSDTDFSNYNTFDRFVRKILQFRDNSTLLHTFDLERCTSTYPSYEREYGNSIPPCILRKIVSYILSHTNHLRRLAISLKGDISLVLPCVSACRALTSLKLSLYPKGGSRNYSKKMLFPKSRNFPALTSLDLTNFDFCADESNKVEPFSAFNRLNSLIICKCAIRGEINTMSISSETLVTLSLITNCHTLTKVELSTPSLCNITFMGGPGGILCGSTLSSVKQLYIEFTMDTPDSAIDSLLKLPNITSLTLTRSTLMMMFIKHPDPDELNKLEFSSLCHLKSLKLKTNRFEVSEECLELLLESFKSWKEDTIDTNLFRDFGRVIGFLCQNSPLV